MQAPFADPLSGLELLTKPLPLVGRDSELQLMCTLLDTVALDRPAGARAVTISGEMGVGKSRLLAEMFVEARARGFRVLEGCAYESGAMFPYLPFIEALRPVLRTSNAKQLRQYVGLESENIESSSSRTNPISLMGTPLVTALSGLFPELPRMVQVAVDSEVLSPDQVKFRLFDAVATLLERMAMDRPVLLCIDNLHWSDSASLELMMYLTVRLHASHVALAGATRPPGSFNRRVASDDSMVSTSANLAAARALGELMRQGMLLFIPLGPLGTGAMEDHLRALLPGSLSESLIQSLLSRVGGNPFFLEELVRMLTLDGGLILSDGAWRMTRAIGSELPLGITNAVEQRLQGLSVTCREFLRVASLFGRTFPLQALVMVMGTLADTENIQSNIDAAVQASLIAPSPVSITILDEYVSELGIGDAKQSLYVSHIATPTYTFCQGIVQEVLSNEVTTDRARVLHGAIGTALEISYGETARSHAAELAPHFVLSGEKEAALRLSLLAGENAMRVQAHREVISHFRMALALMDDNHHPEEEDHRPEEKNYRPEGENCHPERSEGSPAFLHFSIGESWFKLGELERALDSFQQAVEHIQREKFASVQQSSQFALLSAQVNRCMADAYRMQGKYELALAHLQSARKSLDVNTSNFQETYNNLEQVPWISSRSLTVGTDALNFQQVSTAERILLLQAQATLDILLFRGQEAEEVFWQSYQLATEIGDRGSQAFALHFIGWIRGWGEHIHEAIRLLEQAHELYISVGDPFRAALGDQGLGIIYQALGEMEKARLYNLRGLELARRYGVRYVLGWLYWNQGVMALGHGDWPASESHFKQSTQEAQATGNARLKAVTLQAQAELSFRQGNWQVAEQQFKDAIQASINTEWYASIMALYGHFLAITGRRSAAQAQLEAAAALKEPVGYSGHFYIPFLAEAYLHLGANEQAATYIQRIQALQGFMYYGVSVDRILGEVAAVEGNWSKAEQAFENGLELCHRADNQPEQAAILYEKARMLLMRSNDETPAKRNVSLQDIHDLCNQAHELFLKYQMQRAANLVETFREGVRQLEHRQDEKPSNRIVQQHVTHPEYLLDLHLTKRELEVLRLVAEGHTDREVADILVISPRTVNRHLANIYVKLDVPGRASAVAYAIRQGLVG
ncbi:MAG: helix-turn-helix transcriptional regulator [Ktedonobacteraceae bacterium]